MQQFNVPSKIAVLEQIDQWGFNSIRDSLTQLDDRFALMPGIFSEKVAQIVQFIGQWTFALLTQAMQLIQQVVQQMLSFFDQTQTTKGKLRSLMTNITGRMKLLLMTLVQLLGAVVAGDWKQVLSLLAEKAVSLYQLFFQQDPIMMLARFIQQSEYIGAQYKVFLLQMIQKSDYLNISVYLSKGIIGQNFGLVISAFFGPIIKMFWGNLSNFGQLYTRVKALGQYLFNQTGDFGKNMWETMKSGYASLQNLCDWKSLKLSINQKIQAFKGIFNSQQGNLKKWLQQTGKKGKKILQVWINEQKQSLQKWYDENKQQIQSFQQKAIEMLKKAGAQITSIKREQIKQKYNNLKENLQKQYNESKKWLLQINKQGEQYKSSSRDKQSQQQQQSSQQQSQQQSQQSKQKQWYKPEQLFRIYKGKVNQWTGKGTYYQSAKQNLIKYTKKGASSFWNWIKQQSKSAGSFVIAKLKQKAQQFWNQMKYFWLNNEPKDIIARTLITVQFMKDIDVGIQKNIFTNIMAQAKRPDFFQRFDVKRVKQIDNYSQELLGKYVSQFALFSVAKNIKPNDKQNSHQFFQTLIKRGLAFNGRKNKNKKSYLKGWQSNFEVKNDLQPKFTESTAKQLFQIFRKKQKQLQQPGFRKSERIKTQETKKKKRQEKMKQKAYTNEIKTSSYMSINQQDPIKTLKNSASKIKNEKLTTLTELNKPKHVLNNQQLLFDQQLQNFNQLSHQMQLIEQEYSLNQEQAKSIQQQINSLQIIETMCNDVVKFTLYDGQQNIQQDFIVNSNTTAQQLLKQDKQLFLELPFKKIQKYNQVRIDKFELEEMLSHIKYKAQQIEQIAKHGSTNQISISQTESQLIRKFDQQTVESIVNLKNIASEAIKLVRKQNKDIIIKSPDKLLEQIMVGVGLSESIPKNIYINPFYFDASKTGFLTRKNILPDQLTHHQVLNPKQQGDLLIVFKGDSQASNTNLSLEQNEKQPKKSLITMISQNIEQNPKKEQKKTLQNVFSKKIKRQKAITQIVDKKNIQTYRGQHQTFNQIDKKSVFDKFGHRPIANQLIRGYENTAKKHSSVYIPDDEQQQVKKQYIKSGIMNMFKNLFLKK